MRRLGLPRTGGGPRRHHHQGSRRVSDRSEGETGFWHRSPSNRDAVLEQVARIEVHKDRLIIQLRSEHSDEASETAGAPSLSIPWQKPPSRRARQILLPHGVPKGEVRPTRIERRARLVNAIARGRRWLDEIRSGSITDVEQIATRQKCSVRQVNMTISLAFLAPDLVRAAVEGRLPRGIGVERLRDPPPEWSGQFEALGLKTQ
jgi:site-specific DNA recombinase